MPAGSQKGIGVMVVIGIVVVVVVFIGIGVLAAQAEEQGASARSKKRDTHPSHQSPTGEPHGHSGTPGPCSPLPVRHPPNHLA
jgi:hypothetical protein